MPFRFFTTKEKLVTPKRESPVVPVIPSCTHEHYKTTPAESAQWTTCFDWECDRHLKKGMVRKQTCLGCGKVTPVTSNGYRVYGSVRYDSERAT